MSGSIIIDYDCEKIQQAMAVALLQLKNANGLTYKAIGKVIEREPQSVQQYICDTTEMPASCWLKAVAQWPDLPARLEHNLDDAEKAFKSRQRSFSLPMPEPVERAA
jgi:hypothetical protein